MKIVIINYYYYAFFGCLVSKIWQAEGQGREVRRDGPLRG
jgi:hypothetical protein